MIIPSRRKLGAAALIIAGIGAFLVPFLLHSPTTQGTSSNNGGPNPNNGSHTTPPTTTTPTTTPTNPGTKDDSGKGTGDSDGDSDDSGGSTSGTGTCGADKAKDPSPADNGEVKHNGNAWGVLKNQMGMTVAAVKAMGTHNTAFHLHHDTKTDNDTVKAHTSSGDSNENDSSCAEKTETNDD